MKMKNTRGRSQEVIPYTPPVLFIYHVLLHYFDSVGYTNTHFQNAGVYILHWWQTFVAKHAGRSLCIYEVKFMIKKEAQFKSGSIMAYIDIYLSTLYNFSESLYRASPKLNNCLQKEKKCPDSRLA
ncbi:hypothetical protein ACJX0J_017816 [Zea mays]